MLLYLLKRRALEALRRDFSTILLIALIAVLPTLLGRTLVTMGLGRCPELLTLLAGTRLPADLTLEELLAMTEPGRQLMLAGLGLHVLGYLLAFLRLGQLHSQMKLLRGEEIRPADAFSRGGIWLKAIGQQLWQTLWVTLWSLPGLALVILASGLALMGWNVRLCIVLTEAAYLAGVVLAARAALRYALAPMILAEKPETGVLAAQRESIRVMTGKVRYLVFLLISFFGWGLIVTLVGMLIPGVPGAVLGMALDLALSVYISTTVCAFSMAVTGTTAFEDVLRMLSQRFRESGGDPDVLTQPWTEAPGAEDEPTPPEEQGEQQEQAEQQEQKEEKEKEEEETQEGGEKDRIDR